MSKDIRSFFTVISKKSGSDSSKNVSPAIKKKPKRLIDSDDEDVVSGTPDQKPGKKLKTVSTDSDSPKKKPGKKPAIKPVVLSDSDDDTPKKKTPAKVDKGNESKLKPVNISDMFKNTPIKQSKVEAVTPQVEEKEVKKSKSKKNGKNKEKKVHNDKDFEKTLDDLDDDIFEQSIVENLETLEKTEALLQDNEERSVDDKEENSKNENKKPSVDDKEENSKNENKKPKKRSRADSSDESTPKKKKFEHIDSGIDPGQEAHEKKRYSAMLYQKYLHRGDPKHHGMKELPKGKPNCLNNLTFLRTGVLDSLDSDDFDNLIKEHGGRVVKGVSKKVNYVVVGEDPGPAKLAKAETYKIPNISEDELLDLILTKSGMKPKYCQKDNQDDNEDLGIELDSEVKKDEEEKHESKEKNIKEKKKGKTDSVKKKPETTPEKPKSSKSEHKNGSTSESTSIKKNKILSEPEPSSAKISGTDATSESSSVQKNKSLSETEPSSAKISENDLQSEADSLSLPLTEKYKPQSLKAVIGQQGESSNLNKLKRWLENWHKNQDPKVKKTLVRPSPWAKTDNGAYFKCALLSGPPGVGKTTTATLVAKELGLDVVEFNASDTRSKRLLHEEVSQLLSNNTIAGFATGQANVNKKRVLLMDEVDGMAGNEDRGGIQELIQLIKNTSVPIICMCNDRNHQKMRSLVNYCYDLRFSKPRLEQIRGAMMSICFKEKIDIPIQALSEIIAGTGCDVRQTLNNLALLSTSNQKITTEIAEKEAKASKKDAVMGPWEVCRTVFTKSEHKNMSIADKARLFFFDYSLGPLFVQENYLKVQPEGVSQKKEVLLKATLSADSISVGDLIDSKIRKRNNWALLESQAFFSSVIPGHHMSGTFTAQINFPGWLGKNSKKNKFSRLISEIQSHTRTSASASKLAVKLDYLVPLRDAVLKPLKKKGLEGIDEAVEVMKTYNLLREDVDSLLQLCQWTNGDNPMNSIDSKVKSAFTRAYNKQVTLLPYAPTSGISKKRAAAADNELLGEGEEEIVSDDEDDDISKNAMIKVKKQSASRSKKTDDGPSTSKRNETKKGKGKKNK